MQGDKVEHGQSLKDFSVYASAKGRMCLFTRTTLDEQGYSHPENFYVFLPDKPLDEECDAEMWAETAFGKAVSEVFPKFPLSHAINICIKLAEREEIGIAEMRYSCGIPLNPKETD